MTPSIARFDDLWLLGCDELKISWSRLRFNDSTIRQDSRFDTIHDAQDSAVCRMNDSTIPRFGAIPRLQRIDMRTIPSMFATETGNMVHVDVYPVKWADVRRENIEHVPVEYIKKTSERYITCLPHKQPWDIGSVLIQCFPSNDFPINSQNHFNMFCEKPENCHISCELNVLSRNSVKKWYHDYCVNILHDFALRSVRKH